MSKRSDIQVLLTGQEEVVEKELEKYSVSQDRITIVPASEIIATDEPPDELPSAARRIFYCCRNEPGEKG